MYRNIQEIYDIKLEEIIIIRTPLKINVNNGWIYDLDCVEILNVHIKGITNEY